MSNHWNLGQAAGFEALLDGLEPSVATSNLWRRGVVVIVSVEGFVGGQERDVGLHGGLAHINEGERLRGFLGESFEALLHRADFIGMGGSEVVLLVRIFGEVVEFD